MEETVEPSESKRSVNWRKVAKVAGTVGTLAALVRVVANLLDSQREG